MYVRKSISAWNYSFFKISNDFQVFTCKKLYVVYSEYFRWSIILDFDDSRDMSVVGYMILD